MIFEDGTERDVIHLAFQRSDGNWRIACVPNLKDQGSSLGHAKPWLRSDDYRAVSCPSCMQTTIFSDKMLPMKPLIRMLKDDPGRVCIHWFERFQEGPLKKKGFVEGADGKLDTGTFKGRIACHPEWGTVDPVTKGDITYVCTYSDDARAVNCPGCMATPEHAAMMQKLGSKVSK